MKNTPFHMMMNRNRKNDDADFFRTPRDATLALMHREIFPDIILEPACGDGAMAKVISDCSYSVYPSDLYDHGYGSIGCNFLKVVKPPFNDFAVITNPPYRLAEQFIWKCNELGASMYAMLLRLMFLESKRRVRLFKTLPLKTVYVFSYRLAFTTPKDGNRKPGGMTPYAWFVWDKHYEGSPTIGWIEDIYK